MKEVKFRAYVKPKGKVLPVYGLDFSKIAEWPVTIADCGDLECGLCLDYYENKDVEIMQYTGLKDKNGVEIYEGYIVECFYPKRNDITHTLLGDVTFIEGCWFVIEPKRNYYSSLYSQFESILIIGNIYEHPELLGDKA